MRLRKYTRAATKRLRIAGWRAVSPLRRGRLTGDAPVVVSLTSYGHRLSSVFATIESIGAGSVRPERLVLALAHDEIQRGLPATVRELARRGLEILPSEDLLSHKKYYPYAIEHSAIPRPLVTADDDVLYPRTWLEALMEAHRERPRSTVGYRGELIALDEAGQPRPYRQWCGAESTAPSYRLVLNGIGGVLYPIPVLEEARAYGTEFMQSCPKADDLWLHRASLRAGFAPSQLRAAQVHHPSVPGSQKTSLMSTNVVHGNDTQFAAVYSAADLAMIREDPVSA
ncbi:hypothetical protein [Rathayibacter toxicus]|uniref:hypothetical protein n=1 Tax=Rathayibacter toxicus TaxID=145458 RepID=UPI000CE932AC|nr:hypothetical protein [Rathayibacter toxicus]PPI52153.1 hypothetical protein C5D35_10600 [Rathayibacter toxicus]QOD10587.1 hypothetical protein BSG36_00860 [Rathayibacter toxicus]